MKQPGMLARRAPMRKRRRNTGQTRKVRDLVHARSGGICEWPGCWQVATDQHHRLNRKSGGRHGEMHLRINQAAWLADVCRSHHDAIPRNRAQSETDGWLLQEGQDAREVPVLTRHAPGPVLLDDGGDWSCV